MSKLVLHQSACTQIHGGGGNGGMRESVRDYEIPLCTDTSCLGEDGSPFYYGLSYVATSGLEYGTGQTAKVNVSIPKDREED